MAKASIKPTKAKAAPKKVLTKPPVKANASLEKIAQGVLVKLKSLNADQKLQADLEWCIGSYLHDNNPIGVRENLMKSIEVLKIELASKTKGITAKFISEVEKAIS